MQTHLDELVLLDKIPGHYTAHCWRNLLIATWATTSTLEGVQRLSRVRASFIERFPEGTSLIHIAMQPGVPDQETEQAMVAMMKRYSKGLACIGVVTMATGFQGSRLRSKVITMRTVQAPGAFMMRFHTSVEGVCEWLPAEHARRTAVQLEAPRLLQHLQRLIAEHAAGETLDG